MPESTETPTLQEAMEQASSTLQDSEPEEAQQSEGETEAEDTSEVEESAEVEDTPLDKFDPKSLPAELQPVYKNLMKGFTQGRQKDREELNQLRQELEALKQPQPEYQRELSPEEYIQQVAEQTITQKRVEDYKNQALADYDNADPRLKLGGEQYDEVVDLYVATELNRELERYVQANGSELGFPHRDLVKQYLTKWDQKVQSEVEGYLAKQKKLAKKAELNSGRFNPKSSAASVKPSGSMTIEQAMQAAIAKQK